MVKFFPRNTNICSLRRDSFEKIQSLQSLVSRDHLVPTTGVSVNTSQVYRQSADIACISHYYTTKL